MEVWADIRGYEGLYMVSNRGNVRSLSRVVIRRNGRPTTIKGQVIRPWVGTTGRLAVVLHKRGRQQSYLIHRLVLEMFVGPCPEGMECCHEDDDPTNNRLSNLRWGTRLDNQSDRKVNGRTNLGKFINTGTNNPNKKLDEIMVREIRRLFATGEYSKLGLARMFGVTDGNIHSVLNRATWKHV